MDQFTAGGEIKLGREARKVLQKRPLERTRKEKLFALNAIKSHVRGFNEYPIRVQHMIVTYGMYTELSASRVLIKQGQNIMYNLSTNIFRKCSFGHVT